MASLINSYHCCVFTEHNHSEFSFIFRHIFENIKGESLLAFKAGFTCDEVEIGVVNRVVVGSYESSHLKVYVNRDNQLDGIIDARNRTCSSFFRHHFRFRRLRLNNEIVGFRSRCGRINEPTTI